MFFHKKNRFKIFTTEITKDYQYKSVHTTGIFAVGVGFIVIGVGISLLFFNFGLQVHTVAGDSMSATLSSNDQIIVDKFSKGFSLLKRQTYVPKRNHIVILKHSFRGDRDTIVKRVIGLPGERLTIADGKVTIYNQANPDGFNPDEDRFRQDPTATLSPVDVTLGKNEIYVLGDNRGQDQSIDSRTTGPVLLDDVIGEVIFRNWPLNSIGPVN